MSFLETNHKIVNFVTPQNNEKTTFSNRLSQLFGLLTHEQKLNHISRIHLYKELLENTNVPELKDFFNSVLIIFQKYYQNELHSFGNEHYLFVAENLLYTWVPLITKTVYQNLQNVHAFSKSAINAASLLLKEFKHPYFGGAREQALEHFHLSPKIKEYLNSIETDSSYQGVFLTDLFASVWCYILKSDVQNFLIKRLLDEIEDSKNVCLSGRFIRLINTLNGVDERFSFTLSKTEYNKSYIFHQLNKLIDICDWENIIPQTQLYINTKINLREIPTEEIINILQNYTKTTWVYTKGIYTSVNK